MVAVLAALTVLSNLRLRMTIGGVKLALLLLGLAIAFNFIFWQPGNSTGLFVVPHPRLAGLVRGAWAGARLVLMVGFVNLYLLSTPPEESTDAVSFFLSPLRRITKSVASVPIVVMIALRFVPLVAAEGNRITMAQRARGMRSKGSLNARIRDLRPLVVPLFRSILLRADQLSVALDIRCFDPSRPRKSAFAKSFGLRDVLGLCCSAAVLGLVKIFG